MGFAVSEDDHKRVRALFKDSGAINYGIKEMSKLFKKARKALDGSDLKNQPRQELSNLLDYIESRSF